MSKNRSSNGVVSSSLVLALVVGLAACSSSGGGTSPTLAAIQVTPASVTLAVGITQQLTATGAYSDGSTRDITGQVTWSSATIATATVSATGLATAVQAGSTAISATLGGVAGSASLSVVAATLQRIEVAPAGPAIAAGTTQQFAATGHFSNGDAKDVTQQATWASSSTTTATVSAAGLATGVAAGTTSISASLAGVTGAASLSVTSHTLRSIQVTPSSPQIPVGLTVGLTATGTFADGTTQDLTSQATWTTASSSVASVRASGFVTGVSPGSTTITATFTTVSGSTPVAVDASVLQGIVVTPVDPAISVGGTQQFVATGHFSDGDTHDVTSQASWTTSPAGVATMSASGLATGAATGSTRVVATLIGVSGGTNLSVAAAQAIPDPPPDLAAYFQILIDNRITASKTVHLTITANRMALDAPAILNATWLTGGGPAFNDWTRPVFQVVDSTSGSTASGASFPSTYDVTLDVLPLDPSGRYRILMVPFRDPANPSLSLGGSAHVTLTLGGPATMQINTGGPGGYSIALPTWDPNGAGGQAPWDFLEFNCATPIANGKPVCVINTTNVDFFFLGLSIMGRQPDGTYASFGLDPGSAHPVADTLAALDALSADYANGKTFSSTGTFLRYLAPAHSFTTSTTALDAQVNASYGAYGTNPLQFSINGLPYRATTVSGVLTFTQPESFQIAKPSSLDVVAATGPLDVAGHTANAQNGIKFVAAYLNRGVLQNTATWYTPAQYYPAGGTWNAYSSVLHGRFVGGLAYGFSFDDVPSAPPTASIIQNCTSASLVLGDD
jgi:hypothetical protein